MEDKTNETMNTIAAVIVLIFFYLMVRAYYISTEDFPQCRLARDPVLCTELLREGE